MEEGEDPAGIPVMKFFLLIKKTCDEMMKHDDNDNEEEYFLLHDKGVKKPAGSNV